MAELAAGAVNSLLSLIRNEALLLGRVRGDVQFIKEEMESMNSFLQHLSSTAPPGGEHDEQVRTWMKQVRDLAHDCSNCIDVYVQRCDPEIHLARGIRGYIWWVPWFVQAVLAQRRAATELRELKTRARDVGERRQRYGVKVPKKADDKKTKEAEQAPGTGAVPSSGQAGGAVGHLDEQDEHAAIDHARRALAFSVPRILEECTQKLVSWLRETDKTARTYQEDRFLAISIAAPDKEDGADVAHEALAHPSVAAKFEVKLWIKVKLQRFMPMPPTPSNILDSILRELLHEPEREPEPQEDKAELQANIMKHLKGKRVLIVLDGLNYVYEWEKTIEALSELGCATGSAVIATTNYTLGSEGLCNPRQLPIIYSLVHFYYCKVLDLTSHLENKDYSVYIFRDILERCKPHEFCMKIFAHALYASPNRSKEELEKLLDTLVSSGSLDTNATKMIQFSYNDLHRDYKNCFLYLAIFPRGHRIRRSTLVGRWVSEGLIAKESWPSSVHRAERCFDVLVNRWLVHPGDIVAAGKVKSCIVHDIVYEFITKIARKEHFVETRLSHQHARHFSVFSDLQLSSSDSIENFLRKLYRIPQLPLVKVLDLEDCRYFKKNQHYLKNIFKKNQHYLKNICNKLLLLKYLSLRNTDITKLPKEINNLHQLEVLDIRHTHMMTASATKHLVLLKLKRLLAGCIHPSPCDDCVRHKSFSAARLPHRIGKMTNMEVLSHVQASQRGAELKVIDKLWQLRKLGVVIHDKEAHLKNLVRVISDLSESLQSLSISIKPLQASSHGSPSNTDISFKKSPKLLESLSISGITTSGQFLPLLVKYCNQLAKVTLHNTHLNQDNMKDLNQSAKLRCVRLRHKSYIESNLTFKKEEFKKLKYLLVEGSNMTEISFEDESAPELEKIVLSSANMNNISFANGAATQLEKIVLSSINITSITFENEAAPELKEIVLSSTDMNNITFGNGAAPKLKKIALSTTNITRITFGNGAAPNLEEIALSSTNITSITFENEATPNLKKIVLSSFTNVEILSVIIYLPVLKELEFSGSRIASDLLSLFTNANQLSKVILRDTLLKQGDLQILLAKQPNLRSLMLLDKSCDESQLTFNQDEFQKLKLLVVECFGIAKISFAEGAAPKLEKIVWSFTNMESLSGIDNLPALKELEFNGDKIPNQVKEAIEAHRNPVVVEHNQAQSKVQATRSTAAAVP